MNKIRSNYRKKFEKELENGCLEDYETEVHELWSIWNTQAVIFGFIGFI